MQAATSKQVLPMKVFRGQRQLEHLEKSLAEVEKTISTIEQLSKSLEAPIMANINSVCMMDVRVYHTSEITVALGSDFFATVTKDKALEIARLRQQLIQDKIRKIQIGLDIAAKNPANATPEPSKKGHEKILLEKNEAGEEVFEIIEYPDAEAESEEVSQTKPIRTVAPPPVQEPAPAPAIPEPALVNPPQPAPKKISKFKQERLQQKQG